MIALAKETIRNSHCPYSHFPVACVIKTKTDRYFLGVNMENSVNPDSICAEGVALGAMITSGERDVSEVVVYASKDFKCFPCGGCRQKLAEFCRVDTSIHISNEFQGFIETKTLGELLPCSFTSDTMKEK